MSSILLMGMSCSVAKTNSSTKDEPKGDVEVSGTAKDDDPTEFKQAGESVQVGGVNLVDATEYQISIYLVGVVEDTLIYQTISPSPKFNFKVTASGYLRVDVTFNGKTLSAPMPPSFSNRAKASTNLIIDRVTTIAAKMQSIIFNRARSGDSEAFTVVRSYALSIADLTMAASSIVQALDRQKISGKKSDPIDLTDLSKRLVTATIDKLKSKADSYAAPEYANKISEATWYTQFGSDASTVEPRVLCYRASPNFGTTTATTDNVAYMAIKSSGVVIVDAAWRIEAEAYRAATSNTVASSYTTQVSSSYASTYDTCQVSPTTCVSSTFTPPSTPSTETPPTTTSTSPVATQTFPTPTPTPTMTSSPINSPSP